MKSDNDSGANDNGPQVRLIDDENLKPESANDSTELEHQEMQEADMERKYEADSENDVADEEKALSDEGAPVAQHELNDDNSEANSSNESKAESASRSTVSRVTCTIPFY